MLKITTGEWLCCQIDVFEKVRNLAERRELKSWNFRELLQGLTTEQMEFRALSQALDFNIKFKTN